MSTATHFIELQQVLLEYEKHLDKTRNLKEYLINAVSSRSYVDKKKEKIVALKDVSLSIKDGERVGIIGLNGAGKSTILKVISGILKPTDGFVRVHGSVQPLIEIGAGFNPEFSGRENIYLNAYMLGFTKKQIKEKEQEIIEFAELEEFIDVPVKYYSSGMSVRLAFTIATSIEPEILVFDEMLSAGDLSFMKKAQERMNRLLNKARIMVLVSHDIGLIESISNRCLVLHHGQVVFDGKPPEAIQFYKDKVALV